MYYILAPTQYSVCTCVQWKYLHYRHTDVLSLAVLHAMYAMYVLKYLYLCVKSVTFICFGRISLLHVGWCLPSLCRPNTTLTPQTECCYNTAQFEPIMLLACTAQFEPIMLLACTSYRYYS
eukprot:scpid94891/ scgid3690/ 